MSQNAHNPFDPGQFIGLRAVAFDCDGVMFDSFESNRAYYNAVLAGLGLPEMTPDQAAFIHASTVAQAMDRLVPPDRQADLPAVMARVNYHQTYLPLLTPEPGLIGLLTSLGQAGLITAVATNRSDSMHDIIRMFCLERFFARETVITAEVAAPKPSPDGLRLLLARLDLRPDELAFVGDSPVDQQAASQAGVRFWACKNKNLPAQAHVDEFCGLERAFREFLCCQ